jgi:hypothetical protein
MDYDTFVSFVKQCRETWQSFKESFEHPEFKSFLKHSYPVLVCGAEQCSLDATDAYSIALNTPKFLLRTEIASAYVDLVRELERFRKEFSGRGDKDKKFYKKFGSTQKHVDQFNIWDLQFADCNLEVRFPTLRIDLIQSLKESPFIDKDNTVSSRCSIRVVLKVPQDRLEPLCEAKKDYKMCEA